ncbi:glycosyl transferase [Arenicella chitinivorans]|uniref:Glycosyl transferase n=1 Tax=Arenicella chitinivorans TaxID=1329800 RepID=A0A918VJT5_9GAMM|nr:glycosyltransferase [Arenicella chitinivorans]GHA01596.1 glycosyl transferase [Arenicella chitinivorans]
MNLSVIIPTYNRAETLERAVASVLAQDYLTRDSEVEIIVVDDGSDDGTAEFVRSRFPCVQLLQQPNRGVSAARNRGLDIACGEWIALLDSDDEWLPHKLSTQMNVLADTGLSVCHTEEIWIRHGRRINQMNKHQKQGGWIFEQCLPLCAMSPSSIVIHRSVFETVGRFDENLPACEDYDLWLRVAAGFEVAYVAQPCIRKYGGHEDQLSRQYWGMDRFRVIALENCLNHPEIGPSLTVEQRQKTLKTLVKKLNILCNGARKRNNFELVEDCESKLARWCPELI